MKWIIIILLIFFNISCLKAKKSAFDTSSPSGIFLFGAVSLGNNSSNSNNPLSSSSNTSTQTVLEVKSVQIQGGGGGLQINFSIPILASTLNASSNCTGSLQISTDNFATCLAGTITSSDNTNFIFKPSQPFQTTLSYSVKVVKTVTTSANVTLNNDYIHSSSINFHPYLGVFGSAGVNVGNTSNPGQFNVIPGVAVSKDNQFLFVTDHNNNRAQRISVTGTSPSVFRASLGELIFGVALDSNENIFISFVGANRVEKLTPHPSYGGGGSVTTGLNAPRGIAVDSNNNVYIANHVATGYINRYDNNLANPIAFATGLNLVSGVAISSTGFLYAVLDGSDQVRKYDLSGNLLKTWGTNGSGNGQFISPVGIAVDKNGYVYVVDYSRCDIQKFDPDGNFILKIGTTCGSGTLQLNGPAGMAIDSDGYIYVGDQNNNRIMKFGP
ncbi:MAG: hypothetical protein SFU98_20880 [Leptospiraceae bacterium]|nr:hypothetical protein [Leptospiraceae bacterium]